MFPKKLNTWVCNAIFLPQFKQSNLTLLDQFIAEQTAQKYNLNRDEQDQIGVLLDRTRLA